ncbi:MAG: diguanylate cyclase [Pseudomonadota bacterium]
MPSVQPLTPITIEFDENTDQFSGLSLSHIATLLYCTEQWANIGFWNYDLLRSELFWSDQIYRIYGYEPGAVAPDIDMAISAYRSKDRSIVKGQLEQSIATGEPWSIEVDLIRTDGVTRRVRSHGMPQLVDGVVKSVIGVFQDITDDTDTAKHNALISDFIRDTPEGVILADADGRIEWINASMKKLSGYSLEEMRGRKPKELLHGPETDLDVSASIRKTLATGKPVTEEVLNYNRQGEKYWARISISAQYDTDGKPTRYMSIQQDITPQKQAEEQLRNRTHELEELNFLLERQREVAEAAAQDHQEARFRLEAEINRRQILEADLRQLAMTDSLTRLPNRQCFMRRTAQEVSRALRFERPLSLIIFDIDHFKRINDQYGHPMGDEVLVAMAAIIRNTVRESSDIHCRWGGEEFCIASPETDIDGIKQFAERLRQRISRLRIDSDGNNIHVTCSFGVANLLRSDSFSTLMKRADGALYLAKDKGRNRVEIAEQKPVKSPAVEVDGGASLTHQKLD